MLSPNDIVEIVKKDMANVENLSIEAGARAVPFVLKSENGKELARINFDGSVELFGEVNEAAMQFWTAVCQISGGTLTKRSAK